MPDRGAAPWLQEPLTGGWGEADGGGYFGAELKRAGYDALVGQGLRREPVGWTSAEGHLAPADDLWGLDTLATQEAIQTATGDKRTPWP